RGREVFYGREDDFAYVRQRLAAEKNGVVILFVGARRSGKTSIMFQILERRLGEEYLPVFVDMQRLAGVSGDRDFLGRVAELTLEGIRDERLVLDYYDFAQGNPVISFDRMLGDIQQLFPDRRLIMLIDEAEILHAKVETGEVSPAVLTYMASILESRRVSFCLTGSPGISDTQNPEWRRLTGKGDLREISFLSREDTLRLVREPVAGHMSYGEGAPEAIYRLTHGQPFYTQVICTYAVDYLNGQLRHNLEMADLDEVVRTIVDNPPPQLIYEWDNLNRQDQLALALLSEESQDGSCGFTSEALFEAVGRNGYPINLRAEAIHITLEGLYDRKWLERDQQGAYSFRVDLFRQWIRRSRSIWRLVEDRPVPSRRRVWVAAAAGLLVVALGAVAVWMVGPESPVVITGRQAPVNVVSPAGLWVNPGDVRDVAVRIGDRSLTISEPALVDSLEPGTHTVQVTHPDYEPWQQEVVVAAGEKPTVRPQLRRLQGTLVLDVRPEGVRVGLRGPKDTTLTVTEPATALSLLLPTGDYQVSLDKDGHVARQRRVTVRAGQESPVAEELEARAGHLYVRSTPPGAEVSIDGQPSGVRTPGRVANLGLGERLVRLDLADHDPVEKKVTVRQGATDTVDYPLTLSRAVLTLASQPRASVYLGGRAEPEGITPFDLTLDPGTYRIRLVKEGYEAEALEFVLRPGQKEAPDMVTLDKVFGRVRVRRPLLKKVIVDGEAEYDTQPDFELQVGWHTLVLKGGGRPQKIEVLRDTTVTVELD
ncbi:MAG: PEGA domain-containing protein, partial [Candidatus Latescibacterota bacterium]